MKIKETRIASITHTMVVTITYKGKDIVLTIKVKDGKAVGNYMNGISTNYLPYFNDTPERIRARHFSIIKKAIENHVSNP